jgi:hypothetical protein
MRENRMCGEALTTHASLTVDLVLQVLGRHLHNRDAPMREFVDEFRGSCRRPRPLSIGRARRASTREAPPQRASLSRTRLAITAGPRGLRPARRMLL